MHMAITHGWAKRWAALIATAALGIGALGLAAASPAQAATFVSGVVVDSSGRPLYGVHVEVHSATEDPTTGSTYLRDGTTDPDGGFLIDVFDAPAVKVRILGTSAGPGYYEGGEWFNDKPSWDAADPVPPGDLGVITLTPSASISGTVRSAAGAPIEGIGVRASVEDEYSLASASTDAAGAYTIYGVPAGTYKINFFDYSLNRAENPNPAQEYNFATYPSPVSVAAGGAASGIDGVVTPTGYVPTGVELTGRVVDSAGTPQVGAAVSAFTVGTNPRDRRSLGRGAWTNRQGVYNFTDLDTSGVTEVRLLVTSMGNGANAFPRTPTWSGNQSSWAAAEAVPLVPGGVASAPDIVMQVTGGISGTIASDATGPTNAGTMQVYDLQGDPIPSGMLNTLGASSRVDGTYERKGIAPGTYLVRFDGVNLAPEWWGDAALQARAKTVVVKPGELTTGVDASLATGLVAVENPEVKGLPIVGKQLSVTTGVWNQQDNSRFSYEWLANGVVVGTDATFTPTKALVGQKLQARVTNKPVEPWPLFRVFQPASVTVSTYKVGFKTTLGVKAKNGTARFTLKNQKVKAKKIKGRVIAQLVDSEGTLSKIFGKAKIKKGTGSMALKKVLKKAKGDRKRVVFTFVAKTNRVGAAMTTKKANKLKK